MHILFKSQRFLVGILPGLLLVIWIVITDINSHQLSTLENTAAAISFKDGVFYSWEMIKYTLYLFYAIFLIYSLINIKSFSKGKPKNSLKSILITSIIGVVMATFSYLIAALIYDLISVASILATNPSFFSKH